jgi:hypothetical protein
MIDSIFKTPLDAFLQVGFHVIIDPVCFKIIFNKRNGVVYIVELDLTNNRITFFELVVKQHRYPRIVQKTLDEMIRASTTHT